MMRSVAIDCGSEFLLRRSVPFAIKAAGIALGITVAQTLLACLLSGQSSPGSAYASLKAWDGHWFGSIVDSGYSAPAVLTEADPSNTAFFPGYPMLARWVKHLLRVDTTTALLLTAQMSCWGFWTYFLLLCRRWGLTERNTAWAAVLFAVQPCSYYLVAAYSEASFLCWLFGFIYWSEKPGAAAFVVAAAHGFGMTATRLVGIPLVVLPLFQVWLTRTAAPGGVRDALRHSGRPLLLMLMASAGALSYFAYCQFELHAWNLPMKAHAAGWHVQPCYHSLVSPRMIKPLLGYVARWNLPMRDGFLNTSVLDQIAAAALWLVFAAAFVVEIVLRRRGVTGWRDRAPLYLGAFLQYYLSVSGHITRGQGSMIRFTVCILALLLPALIMLVQSRGRPLPTWAKISLALWLATSLAWNLTLTYRFAHGYWVA